MSANVNIVELIGVSREISWLSWGVQYFFLIGLSYGAFFLTLPAFVFGRRQMEKTARLALVVAISCGIAAPVALVSDLHQPGRFYNFYLHFTPTSWMSWGSFFLPAYVILLLIYAWLIYRPDLARQANVSTGIVARLSQLLAFGGAESTAAIKMLGYLTILAAVLVVTYTGSEMAVVRARPLWNSPMMPLLYLLTGVSGAAGLGLLLNRFIADASQLVSRQLSRVLLISQFLIILMVLLWMFTGLADKHSSATALIRLATEYNPIAFSLFWLGLCTLLPLLLVIKKLEQAWWLTGMLSVAGTWLFRWSMFIDGQRIPKNAAGFIDYSIPSGTEGLLGIAGTAGLWLLLMLIIISFVPWAGSEHNISD
ncbi:Tetrathionate reductase subunit C [hydrothermal vent metagenome]|uniref:Tetrathionate reductase subunit C n=1 Tax=hydrothermal vent metagenome TaxID=652676 RepID=A0A3B1BH55_9ZZZZ